MLMSLQVLHGGENLLDKVEQLKQRSAATKSQLEVAARQQEEQRQRLEQLQLERLDLDAQYSSLEVRVVQGCDYAVCRAYSQSVELLPNEMNESGALLYGRGLPGWAVRCCGAGCG